LVYGVGKRVPTLVHSFTVSNNSSVLSLLDKAIGDPTSGNLLHRLVLHLDFEELKNVGFTGDFGLDNRGQ
jgi:hypothetical protein